MTIYFSSIGTCGFGDTCIFLHDRSSLKVCESVDTGWDIMQQKKRKAVEAGLEAFMDKEGGGEGKDLLFGNDGDNDDGNEGKAGTEKKEELPFACFICRKPFTNPVVTLCNHYFCSNCIMGYAKKGKCAVCHKSTKGVFNSAKKILAQAGK